MQFGYKLCNQRTTRVSGLSGRTRSLHFDLTSVFGCYKFDSHIISVGKDLIQVTKENESQIVNIKTKYFQSFQTITSNPRNISYLYDL